MKSIYILETYDQLRALSDRFRSEMMIHLIEKPYTGQQLAEKLGISRAKIHYHLRELEKNDLIEIVRKEEKNGIVQKFYRSVAMGFNPGESLLPYKSELGAMARQATMMLLNRTQTRVMTAPEEAFKDIQCDHTPSDWGFTSTQVEAKLTREQFKKWSEKYIALLDELGEMEKQSAGAKDSQWYYMMGLGFHIDEPLMPGNNEEG